MNLKDKELLRENFEFLFEEDLLQEIISVSNIKNFTEGQIIMDINQSIEFAPLIISGSIKILTEDESGNELLLYYLEQTETCAISLNLESSSNKSSIRAIAEMDTKLLMIPIELVDKWMVKYPKWRKFIINSYQFRLREMLNAIDTLAFNNMENRVLLYLKDKMLINSTDILRIKHNDIANDLHTSRVVVSRIMKKLELEGFIVQNRNKIQIVDINNLLSI